MWQSLIAIYVSQNAGIISDWSHACLQVSWCAAKSSLYFICRSNISPCSFSYSDTVGPPNFCWTNLQDKIYKKLGYDIWSILHIYMCEYDCLNVCTYITTDNGPFCGEKEEKDLDFHSVVYFLDGLKGDK